MTGILGSPQVPQMSQKTIFSFHNQSDVMKQKQKNNQQNHAYNLQNKHMQIRLHQMCSFFVCKNHNNSSNNNSNSNNLSDIALTGHCDLKSTNVLKCNAQTDIVIGFIFIYSFPLASGQFGFPSLVRQHFLLHQRVVCRSWVLVCAFLNAHKRSKGMPSFCVDDAAALQHINENERKGGGVSWRIDVSFTEVSCRFH